MKVTINSLFKLHPSSRQMLTYFPKQMEKLTWELRRKWDLRQGGENKCYFVFRTNGGPCSDLKTDFSQGLFLWDFTRGSPQLLLH